VEADWAVEIGGGAPVIEALWPGFIDLRVHPEQVSAISEAASSPPLAKLLLKLNAASETLWTSKCDLWNVDAEECMEPAGLACYVDLLPRIGTVFSQWQDAESYCRHWVKQLETLPENDCSVELIVRQAIAGDVEGFAITAYLSATGQDHEQATQQLSALMLGFVASIPLSL
jgi:hypothetical protein